MTTTDTNAADPNAATDECCGSCSSTETVTTEADVALTEETDAMITTTYTVTGMTCGHCVHAISTEIGKLAGVRDVQVDLPTGAVTITSAAPLPQAQVSAAVDEAGYELAATGAGVGTEGERSA